METRFIVKGGHSPQNLTKVTKSLKWKQHLKSHESMLVAMPQKALKIDLS